MRFLLVALFVLFGGVGAAIIVSPEKVAGLVPWPLLFENTTNTLVAFMVAYAVLVGLILRQYQDDRTADNVYYLGFVYTLISIIASLLHFTSGTDVTEIVRNFGLAAATTVAGVALRIALTLLRREPSASAEAATADAADISGRLGSQLRLLEKAVDDFRAAIAKEAGESFTAVRTAVAGHAEELGKSLNSIADQTVGPIRVVADGLRAGVAEIGATAVSIAIAGREVIAGAEAVKEGMGRLAQTADQASSSLSALRDPGKFIEVELHPLSESFAALVNELRADIQLHRLVLDEALRDARAGAARRPRFRLWRRERQVQR